MNAPIDIRSRFIADLAEALDMPDATPAALLREVVALKARTQPATDADLVEVARHEEQRIAHAGERLGTEAFRALQQLGTDTLPILAADLANCRRLIRQHKAAAMGTDSRAAWEVAEELWRAVP